MSNVFLDIESVPTQDPEMKEFIVQGLRKELDAAIKLVTAPGNYKDPDKIAQFCADKEIALQDAFAADTEAAYRATALDGGMGQLCVIGFAVDDDPPTTIVASDMDGSYVPSRVAEAEMLRAFFEIVKNLYSPTNTIRFVGHNLVGFDLPFLAKRAVVLGVKPPPWLPRNPKPWDERVYDTMTEWAGQRDRISLDKLCRILGLQGKGEISGADVWPMVQAGRLAEVAEYCGGDVERCRNIYRRMTFAKPEAS